MALQHLLHIEDKNLLSGHICLLFGDYQRAQELFLASSQPLEALHMRRNLLHWEQALKLAQTLDSDSIPEICVRFGQQLEFRYFTVYCTQIFKIYSKSVISFTLLCIARDDSEHALNMYENACKDSESKSGEAKCPEDLLVLARMGVAR